MCINLIIQDSFTVVSAWKYFYILLKIQILVPCHINSPPVTKSATFIPEVSFCLFKEIVWWHMFPPVHRRTYKYFSFLTCTTWGVWVNVAKCFGIHVPSFNHTLFHFDQTEAPHCGKKKIHWDATCHKICEIYSVNKNMCATKYKLRL